jgi:hypothetical protein
MTKEKKSTGHKMFVVLSTTTFFGTCNRCRNVFRSLCRAYMLYSFEYNTRTFSEVISWKLRDHFITHTKLSLFCAGIFLKLLIMKGVVLCMGVYIKSFLIFTQLNWLTNCSIAHAERDGTCAETRFRLSPKWTSPFKLVGASVQLTAGSRGVPISLSNAGYTTFGGGVRLLGTHSIRQFPLQFPSCASPCATRFQTSYKSREYEICYQSVGLP